MIHDRYVSINSSRVTIKSVLDHNQIGQKPKLGPRRNIVSRINPPLQCIMTLGHALQLSNKDSPCRPGNGEILYKESDPA